MNEMQTIVTDDSGACLSRGSTRLHCTKTAVRINVLFWLNTPGSPRTIVLYWRPHSERRGELVKILPIVNPVHTSRLAEALEIWCAHTGLGALTKIMQKQVMWASRAKSRDPHLHSDTLSYHWSGGSWPLRRVQCV